MEKYYLRLNTVYAEISFNHNNLRLYGRLELASTYAGFKVCQQSTEPVALKQ
jgi:hypothetical protein